VVNDVSCAIMMKDSAIDILKEKVLVGERGNKANSSDAPNNKKRRTGSGNAAVDTEFGATAFRALTSSERRDTRQNKQTSDKYSKDLATEKSFLEKNLAMLDDRKKRTERLKQAAKELWEKQQPASELQPGERQDTTNTTDLPQPQGGSNANTASSNSSLCSEIMIHDVPDFWDCRVNDTKEDMVLFLRLFQPRSGVLSKSKALQWGVIQVKILPVLSEASVVAKEEESRRRLAAIVQEMIDLNEEQTLIDS
jgi:hypothetical protein